MPCFLNLCFPFYFLVKVTWCLLLHQRTNFWFYLLFCFSVFQLIISIVFLVSWGRCLFIFYSFSCLPLYLDQRRTENPKVNASSHYGCGLPVLGRDALCFPHAWTRDVEVRERSEPQEIVSRLVLFFRLTLQVSGVGGSVPRISYRLTVEQLLPKPVS